MEILNNLPEHTGKLSYTAGGLASHFEKRSLFPWNRTGLLLAREVQMPVICFAKKMGLNNQKTAPGSECAL